MTEAFVLLAGLAVGSFLNVCIHRLPKDESIVRPRSHCPNCMRPVAWFDNIPLVSFLILRGRCRQCRARISWRYPAVELVSGLLWFLSWRAFEGGPMFWIQTLFLTLLLVVSLTDLETGLIPDEVSVFGIVAGLATSFLYPDLHAVCRGGVKLALPCGLIESVMGLAVGGTLLYLTAQAGNWIFQRESMGGGDIKFLAMVGVFLGWQKVLLTFFTAPLPALPFALYRRWVKREEIIPYGPFLALAAAVQFFYGDVIWKYFLEI